MTKIFTYINFLLKSTNGHSVHSPFVYHFITECIYKKNTLKKDKIELLNDFKDSLIKNNQSIYVTEFGAGSKYFKNNKRKISAIAKLAGISKKRSHLLLNIAHYCKVKKILEIGTSLGIATSSLSIANLNAKITTLEGCPETAKIAKQQFDHYGFKNIELKIGDFKKTLGKVIENNKYDLIYFDGNHQKQATINYFEQCLTTVKNETVFIFDDIHWSKGMEEAWDFIKNHKKVTVSIDTYQWGIIFFRKEQPKEHFIIRV